MEKTRNIRSGIYLVIDPSMEENLLMEKLRCSLREPIAAVQIWDNFTPGQNALQLIRQITGLCHEKDVPVIINNQWKLFCLSETDGIHFDSVPGNYTAIKEVIARPFISGLTCGNDPEHVRWAHDNGLDYISFCSIFPSTTANSCELIDFETIRSARKITPMPIFLSGGITPENMPELHNVPFDGVAIVSGIMGADEPDRAIKTYSKYLT
jgi:thiamine-phosphate pyrophosphorylase